MAMTVAKLRAALAGVPDDTQVLVQLNFVVGEVDGAELCEVDVNDLAESYRDGTLKNYDYDNSKSVRAFLIYPDQDDYLLSRDET